jgi:tetratricopeptide (TPR) repeat protein
MVAGKAARPKPIAKRSLTEKAPARKATKSTAQASSKNRAAKKPAKSAPPRKATPPKSAAASKSKTAARKPAPKAISKSTSKPAQAKPQKKSTPAPTKARAAQAKAAKQPPERKKPTSTASPQSVPRHVDEAAALRTFERAHKEFVRGHFTEARTQFRTLIEKYSAAAEVAARARTYLAIAEARLRTESSLPRDADSLYDRGVIELNRGDYVAAQELFERALKREPESAHIHYGLAATRARLGSIGTALESLQHALEIQPSLRVRAQHDPDLSLLRNDPEFEQLVFAPRY